MKFVVLFAFFILSAIIYQKGNGFDRRLCENNRIKQITPIIICFIISFLFAIKLDLSPFNDASPKVDSSVFLYMGKSMFNGGIPYKDLFDHKGIILYFIEYLGYIVGFGHYTGVWILELINIFATSVIFYHIARLFSNSRIVCYLSVFSVVLYSSLKFFEGGNLVEEYALPWISLSLYFVIKFFVTKTYKNWHIVLIGLSFTIVLFLRVNMVGLWGTLLLAVICYFIKSKKAFEIIKCTLWFLLGCLAVLVPILVYLIATNSLKDMINYYLVFNFAYTGSNAKNGMITLFLDCISLAGVSSLFIVYALARNFKNKVLWINILALIFAYLSAAISGRPYHHYGMILIPFFIIPAVMSIAPLIRKTGEILKKINKKSAFNAIIIASIACIAVPQIYYIYSAYNERTSKSSELCEYLKVNTKETDDVLVLGNHAINYINANRFTKNKFFYQDPPIEISQDIYEDFVNEIKTKPSDYVVAFVTDETLNDMGKNYQDVIKYLDQESKKGNYQLEKYDEFQIYIRK